MRPALRWVLVVASWALGVSLAFAQFRGGELNTPIRRPPSALPDRNFVVCRLMYRQVRSEPSGGGWRTDYPYGEINLTRRLSRADEDAGELGPRERRPNYYIVRLTDDALFQCPFLMASDVGTVGMSRRGGGEAAQLPAEGRLSVGRRLLGRRRPGSSGPQELGKVLPPPRLPIEDVPLEIRSSSRSSSSREVPQITNIGFWRRGGGARNLGARRRDAPTPSSAAIRDPHGRIMVVMTHNTDVADSWEREGEDPAFFYQFSPNGYALGINVLLHAMTH